MAAASRMDTASAVTMAEEMAAVRCAKKPQGEWRALPGIRSVVSEARSGGRWRLAALRRG